eukprot:XP_001696565.1 predicted protein [Chlamydomonas reinhardtii]
MTVGGLSGQQAAQQAALANLLQMGVVLPLTKPSSMLSLALYRRNDTVAGKKVLNVRAMIGMVAAEGLVGKLRLRPSSLAPGRAVDVCLPLKAERSGSRPCATVAWEGAVSGAGLSATLPLTDPAKKVDSDALRRRERRLLIKWLSECSPGVSAAAARKLVEDGRTEFNAGRTGQNWKRIGRAFAATEPMQRFWSHVQSWRQPGLTLAVAAAEVAFLIWPSRVLAALLLWAVRSRATPYFGEPGAMVEDIVNDPDPATARAVDTESAAAGDGGAAAGAGAGGGGGVLSPSASITDARQLAAAASVTTATPTQPQPNVLDDIAGAMERVQHRPITPSACSPFARSLVSAGIHSTFPQCKLVALCHRDGSAAVRDSGNSVDSWHERKPEPGAHVPVQLLGVQAAPLRHNDMRSLSKTQVPRRPLTGPMQNHLISKAPAAAHDGSKAAALGARTPARSRTQHAARASGPNIRAFDRDRAPIPYSCS